MLKLNKNKSAQHKTAYRTTTALLKYLADTGFEWNGGKPIDPVDTSIDAIVPYGDGTITYIAEASTIGNDAVYTLIEWDPAELYMEL